MDGGQKLSNVQTGSTSTSNKRRRVKWPRISEVFSGGTSSVAGGRFAAQRCGCSKSGGKKTPRPSTDDIIPTVGCGPGPRTGVEIHA